MTNQETELLKICADSLEADFHGSPDDVAERINLIAHGRRVLTLDGESHYEKTLRQLGLRPEEERRTDEDEHPEVEASSDGWDAKRKQDRMMRELNAPKPRPRVTASSGDLRDKAEQALDLLDNPNGTLTVDDLLQGTPRARANNALNRCSTR